MNRQTRTDKDRQKNIDRQKTDRKQRHRKTWTLIDSHGGQSWLQSWRTVMDRQKKWADMERLTAKDR